MSANMYTDGRYLAQNPDWGRGDAPFKVAFIRDLMQRNNVRPRNIIELGTGSGAILESLANTEGVEELRGYDISPQAIEMAQRIQSPKTQFFCEDLLQRNDYHSELMLVIDVLEHVDDYYQLLRTIRARSDYFIFHIPLDLCCRTLLKPHVMLQQRRAVGHIHYFNYDMVRWMLEDTGYTIVDWTYTGSETDRGMDRSWKGQLKKTLRRWSFALGKDLSARLWGGYSMMILAR